MKCKECINSIKVYTTKKIGCNKVKGWRDAGKKRKCKLFIGKVK